LVAKQSVPHIPFRSELKKIPMRLRINQLDLPPGYSPEQLLKAVAKALSCNPSALSNPKTIRRSIDARGRSPRMTVTVEVEFSGALKASVPNVDVVEQKNLIPSPQSSIGNRQSPILVVGAGPAGLMAAMSLAEVGLKPLMIERGEAAAPRAEAARKSG